MYEYFKWQTYKIAHEKTRKWLQKGNLSRENESPLIRAKNNAIWTNYIQAKTDDIQQDSKCR